jgi:hypothetical protein
MRNHVKGRAGKEPPTKEERHEIGDEIIPFGIESEKRARWLSI